MRSTIWTACMWLAVAFGATACSESQRTDNGGADADVDEDAGDGEETTGRCPEGEDPDGDRIPTTVEGGETVDLDGDTVANAFDPDSDGDTVPDETEAGGGLGCQRSPRDADGDTTPDYLDTDSDANTIPDSVEGAMDSDADGTVDANDLDDDNDGMRDEYEIGGDPDSPLDTDGDGTPDYLDADSDGDGIPDSIERQSDPDADGLPSYRDDDSDGDGIPDAIEGYNDPDEDFVPNYLDLDSDNDGLPDAEEAHRGTDPTSPDTDSDRWDDLTEVALGTDPTSAESAPPEETFYFILPYEDPAGPKSEDFDFTTTIAMADVFFLIDTTNSMAGEIRNLLDGLRDPVIPGLLDRIPDVAMGVGRFEDFPVLPYGEPGDRVFELEQQVTTEHLRVYDAIAAIEVGGGGDLPESSVAALYAVATGDPIGIYTAPFIPDPTAPGSGRLGGVGFRAEAQPIVVVITDAAFHNDSLGADAYDPGRLASGTPNIVYDQAVAALGMIGARVIGVASLPEARPDLEDIAIDTGTVRADGTPLVFDVAEDGSGLSTSVVDAVEILASGTPQDVDTFLEDYPGDAVDATLFIDEVRPISAVPPAPSGFSHLDDTTFYGVIPGTIVTFRVTAFNDIVAAEPVTQVFRCRLVVRGNGVARLDEYDVIVLVPAHGATVPIG